MSCAHQRMEETHREGYERWGHDNDRNTHPQHDNLQ